MLSLDHNKCKENLNLLKPLQSFSAVFYHACQVVVSTPLASLQCKPPAVGLLQPSYNSWNYRSWPPES
ncbi:hypothetical protein CTI12_AA198770 [Artemisia annua]|uniref:Uncharacterized protein n=1 Tax=Artemisia annua TaxID=35608 RepID=A0A2U1ME88_ARTAN|nr:hypothetical protein CTI12_AA198770 [Artemisia annua]